MTLVCPAVFARQTPRNPTDTSASKSDDSSRPQGVEILSDTGGVDVHPYVKQILPMLYRNWTPLIPAEAKPPQSEQATSSIRFTILPNGKIGAMHLDTSTGEDEINRSCWNAITSTQFPALPEAMGSKSLELRIHFYVNTKPPQ
jgi:TonB family protein